MKRAIRNAGAAAAAGGACLYTVYKMTFGKNKEQDDSVMLQGKQYEPYKKTVQKGMAEAEKLSFQRIFIESSEGITLSGRYYHFQEGAPLILFFHGYRGTALRDGNGILLFAKKEGCNILLADQRAHGKSGGNTITFGIKERYDCMDWIRYAERRFGKDQQIILAGISMGASTVLMAADLGLPTGVKGILADCPYSAPKDILQSVIAQMRLPVHVTYTAVRLAGRIFGRFDVEAYSAAEAMRNCRIPVLFIHGDADYFVPCSMSKECYNVCSCPDKKHVVVEGAPHGMSFCVNKELYENEVKQFMNHILM